MKKEFLMQVVTDGGDMFLALLSDAEVVERINMNDVYNEQQSIWYVAEFGKAVHCTYKGWQPHCLVEVVRDDTGETVVYGYGEDH